MTRRSAEDAEGIARTLSVHGRALDLERSADVLVAPEWLPRGAIVVDCAPPSARGPDAERELVRSAHTAGAVRIVYISSTGVYPPGDGGWIDERSPVGPTSHHGHARLAAETVLLEECEKLGLSAVSLRAVGIYGPGRGVHTRLRAGNYRVIGAGNTFVNRLHVDDLVAAIIAAATAPTLPEPVYLVADDRPETSRTYADAVAHVIGVPRAPSVPESSVAPWIVSMLGANRRVSNARIKKHLALELSYPTWREGLVQVLAEDGIPMVAEIPPARMVDQQR